MVDSFEDVSNDLFSRQCNGTFSKYTRVCCAWCVCLFVFIYEIAKLVKSLVTERILNTCCYRCSSGLALDRFTIMLSLLSRLDGIVDGVDWTSFHKSGWGWICTIHETMRTDKLANNSFETFHISDFSPESWKISPKLMSFRVRSR